MAVPTSCRLDAGRRARRLLALLVVAAVTLLTAPRQADAQDPDIIRGTVTGPTGAPLAQAQVTVTSLAAQTTRTGRTDDRGRFTILFANGGGDYFVRIVSIGLLPFETRVQRIEDDPVLLVTAKLESAPTMLEAMRVQAQRERVRTDPLGAPDVGGSETVAGGGAAALSPAEQGSLAAIAATVAGVTLIPGMDGGAPGFSVLGLGADQNLVTLNGMAFDAGNVPRDANVVTTVSTSTFDVSRGGFSGAQLSVRTMPSSNFIRRTLSISMDHPTLQWTDPSAARFGEEYQNYQVSGSFSGPLVRDKAFFNLSGQLGRRSSDLTSLLGADPVSLQRLGIAPDSLDRFLGLLDQLGVPATVGGVPSSQLADNGSLLARVDLAPSGQRTLNFTASGSWNRSGGIGIGNSGLPARGGETSGWNASVQGNFSTYLKNFLNESRLGVTARESEGTPYLSLPEGRVRIRSQLPDGTTGISTLAFGGNGSLDRMSRNRSFEFGNTTSWFTLDSRHRLKLSAELRYDQYTQDETADQLGRFTYNSLADLEAGLPASFSRRLTPRLREGDALNLAFSLGDEWRPIRTNRSFRVQYGVRLEGTRFGTTPRYNAEVEELFGLRTDDVPDALRVSPRLGFTWSYGSANRLRGPFNEGPRATLSGGIGQFRNNLSSSLLATAIDNTGLPDGAQLLNCLGPATPSPDWWDYAADLDALPGACADGSAGTPFAERQPRVYLFDPHYEAQRSWRGNLAWSGRVVERFRLRAEVVHSLNLNQPGGYDVNFSGEERFQLAGEDGRPVYVAPSSIVPSTGGAALLDSRLHNEYTQVTAQRSDLKSRSTRLSFNLSPQQSFNSSFGWGVGYTLSWNDAQERGFNGTTVGDPRLPEWGPAGDSRHQVNLNGNYTIRDAVNLSVFGRLSSGRRFTPRVGGDVNGDGMSNDRAFVFDPATTADPSLAAGMAALLAEAPGEVSACLREQLGGLAGRNSCSGPWTATMSMRVGIVPGSFGLPQRTSLSLSIANPLPAVDELLHGRNGLRGWGQQRNPESTLLYVRGFDPQAQRYVYEVNPRFGDTRPSSSVGRAPFRLSLELRTSFGPTPDEQTLDRQLSMGRSRQGTKMTAAQFRQQLGRSAGGPIQTLLQPQVRDSLGLSKEQLDSLVALQTRHTAAVDTIFTPVAEYLASLGDRYDAKDAAARVRDARERASTLTLDVTRRAREILTPAQLRQLPSFVQVQFDEDFMRRTRRAGGDAQGVMMRF